MDRVVIHRPAVAMLAGGQTILDALDLIKQTPHFGRGTRLRWQRADRMAPLGSAPRCAMAAPFHQRAFDRRQPGQQGKLEATHPQPVLRAAIGGQRQTGNFIAQHQGIAVKRLLQRRPQ